MPKIIKTAADVFNRVTSDSLSKFKQFKSEDLTNITTTYRNHLEYQSLLLGRRKNLKELITTHSVRMGRKIKLLDAGCGECTAIDDLLSAPELDNAIERISGVSLHYFTPAKLVVKKHPKRFVYFLGKVQSVLAQSYEKFDIILDAWGAYSYSSHKLDLLKQYHDALTPGGVAHIFVGRTKLSIKTNEGQVNFFAWAVKSFPETFSFTKVNDQNSITLTKSTLRYPLAESPLLASKEIRATPCPISFFVLKKGNGIAISEVAAEPRASRLRSLPC